MLKKTTTIVLLALIVLLTTTNAPLLAATNISIDNGAATFQANCAGCHAKGGNIVRRGKNLKLKALHKNKLDTQDAITNLVTNGKNNMSAYGDKLSQEEIANVSAYVLKRAEEGWK